MSFKRRTPAGTKPPAPSPSVTFSTGIPSLDDVLGVGGMPSGTVLVALTPDRHSSYGDLLQKYNIAQGLHSGHGVCVFGDRELVDACMWVPQSVLLHDETAAQDKDQDKMTIAWRYENVKQFQTTVDANLFDLSTRIPPKRVADALDSRQLRLVDVSANANASGFERCLDVVREELSNTTAPPLRICLPSMGSFEWGDVTATTVLRFLHSLRGILRGSTSQRQCTVTVTLPAHMAEETFDCGWIDKLGWLSDACITFAAFSADPSMAAVFPAYHGLVRIHSLPAPQTFAPPSDRTSVLRGLSASASSEMGLSENNLAFKATRKKFVIETLHLDLDGGVSERRTTPAHNVDVQPTAADVDKPAVSIVAPRAEEAAVHVEEAKPKKAKKKVGFVSDRPELYDF